MKKLLMWALGVPLLVLSMVMVSFSGSVWTDPDQAVVNRH
jgi:hypothetical protein